MAEFNPDLYDFLKENETCIWDEMGELKFGVHVHFAEIGEFIDIVGDYHLDDGGLEVTLNNTSTLFIPLEDIFTNDGYLMRHYKNCFDAEHFKEAIKKFDGVEI